MARSPQSPMDFTKYFADMKLPALPDLEVFLTANRKNLETLSAANRVALEGAQAVARRHMEMVQSSMTEMTEAMKALAGADAPQAKAAKQAELLKQAYQHAVAHMTAVHEDVLQHRPFSSIGRTDGVTREAQVCGVGHRDYLQ